MNFDPNDPKWTAYLLNELGEADRKAVEAELEQNPEARQWLEEMRETSTLLENTFSREPELHLSSQTKHAILAKSREKKNPVLALLPTLAAAAVVALTLGGWWILDQQDRNEKTVKSDRVWIPAEVSSDASDELDTLLAQGRKELETGDYEQAETTFETVLSKDRYNREALHELENVNETRWGEQQVERRSSTKKMMEKVDESWLVPLSLDQRGPKESATGKPRIQEGQNVSEVTSLSEMMSNVSSPVVMPALKVSRGTVGRLEGERVSAPPVISPSLDHFDPIEANTFRKVSDHPLSTFSIDVDTASYSVVRKFLNEGRMPPSDAVRVEELINYFPYDYAPPQDGEAFAAHMEMAACPWAPEHSLVRIALKGQEISAEERPALNLVYLLDVSGSMNQSNKLPLVKRSLEALVTQLDERDRISIVVYAGAAGLVLPSTSGEDSKAILEALRNLKAGGGTAGGAGIQLAYKTAREQFVKGGVNRVILCTDGDFNIGMTQTGDMQDLIEKEAKSGVFLTALGFGMGNYKDSMLETLSNKGNGNYAYIDDFTEARKVLVDQMLGTLVTIAKDVKIQVEFNPAQVAGYRLIGYENRMLKKEDFNNDKVDAGEIGAGHTVTAFYEVVPAGQPVPGGVPKVDALKYQASPEAEHKVSPEILTLKVRHKQPEGEVSVKREYPLMPPPAGDRGETSKDFRFATSVAAFGLWLRDPEFAEQLSLERIFEMGDSALGLDRQGYRRGFLDLMRNASSIPRE